MMRLWRWTKTSRWVLPGLVLAALPAEAIPSFARKYSINCSTCHQMNPPRLNALGRNFQELGYQLPKGAERPVASSEYKREDEKLTILESLPLALRIKNVAFVRNETESGENRLELNTPSEMQLLAGGALFEDISFFVNFPFFTNGKVGKPILAYVQFNELVENQWANLRIGLFNVLGFQFPNHRGLTVSNARAPAVEVGRNPVVLDDHQVGLQVFGRPRNGAVFYEVALVNGAEPEETAVEGGHAHGGTFSTDANDAKDVFARVTYSTPSRMHTVGVLGYFGKSPVSLVPDSDHGANPEAGEDHSGKPASLGEGGEGPHVDDRFRILGLDGEFNLGGLNIRSALYAGHYSRPFGTGGAVNYQSVLTEVTYAFSRRWLGMAHYDQVISSDLGTLEQKSFTPHLSFLLLDNLRLSLEYHIDLDQFAHSRAFTLIDLTM